MKNKMKLLGIIAIAAIIGFSMTGCMSITVVDPVETKWIQPNPRDFTVLGIVEFQQNQRKGISMRICLTMQGSLSRPPTLYLILESRV